MNSGVGLWDCPPPRKITPSACQTPASGALGLSSSQPDVTTKHPPPRAGTMPTRPHHQAQGPALGTHLGTSAAGSLQGWTVATPGCPHRPAAPLGRVLSGVLCVTLIYRPPIRPNLRAVPSPGKQV